MWDLGALGVQVQPATSVAQFYRHIVRRNRIWDSNKRSTGSGASIYFTRGVDSQCYQNIIWAQSANSSLFHGAIDVAITPNYAGNVAVYNNLVHGTKRWAYSFRGGGTVAGKKHQFYNNFAYDFGTNAGEPYYKIEGSAVGNVEMGNNISTLSTAIANHFVNPSDATLANRDYHSKAGGDLVNAGVTVGLSFDFDGVIIPQQDIPDVGPYEFLADDQGVWSASAQNTTGSWATSSRSGQSARCILEGAYITAATTVRMVLHGALTGSYTMEHVTIGNRDTGWDIVDGSVVNVTFGGTWAAGVTVNVGETVYSDNITFTTAPGQDLLVTYYGPNSIGVYFNGGLNDSSRVVAGDESQTLDWAGLTPLWTGQDIYNLIRLEEVVDPITQSAPSVGVALSQIVVKGIPKNLGVLLSDQDSNIVEATAQSTKSPLNITPSGAAVIDLYP